MPGATARATRAPDGSPAVLCQDGRMSFLNPGDRESDDGPVLPDACAGFDCGERGQCVTMNMTPTCVCDQGFVAIAKSDASGALSVSCVEPQGNVPDSFYLQRLLALPPELPGGREVEVAAVLPPLPATGEQPAPVAFPVPRGEPIGGNLTGGGGCGMTGRSAPAPWLLGVGLVAAGWRGRRRSRERSAGARR
jgi:hypothetical protein